MIERRLNGRYELKEKVGGGGMAVVYRATDLVLQRTVAIKFINQQLSTDQESLKRFQWEAWMTGQLAHPNVVNVYDIRMEDSEKCMVMEFIEGETLKEYIDRKGHITDEEFIEIACQICKGLEHAHQKGIIHRDIKPENIMRSKDGRLKITDFGISRLASVDNHLTQIGIIMGSTYYLSPEQAVGKKVDYRSDLYALGVVLFEMITGTVPFDGEETVAIARKHASTKPPDIRKMNPQVPKPLIHIIYKLLSKDPRQRFQSAEECRQALLQIKRDRVTVLREKRIFKKKILWTIIAGVCVSIIILVLLTQFNQDKLSQSLLQPKPPKELIMTNNNSDNPTDLDSTQPVPDLQDEELEV